MTPEDKHDWKIRKLQQKAAARPDDLEVRLDLGEAYFQKGYYFEAGDEWFDSALALGQEYLQAHPNSSPALDLVAGSCFGLGQLDQAEEYYLEALRADPADALAMVGMANLHRRGGNLGRAIEALRQAARTDENLWQAHFNLGDALYEEAKAREFRGADPLMDEAIYHLVTAIRSEPFPGFMGNAYKNLGELFLYTHQYNQAQRFFRKLVDHPQFGHVAAYYLGLTYLSLNKPKNAIQYFRTYLQTEPDSPIAHSKIALCHLEQEEYDRAREACLTALECDPDNVMARFTLGCTALASGRFAEAVAEFESILDDEPDYFPAYVELVKTHHLRGDYRWLLENLGEEIQGFDAAPGYDGGRRYYKGAKGKYRRRIDVLLAQLKEIGLHVFDSLSQMLQETQSDSLRFQIWEELYAMSRQRRVDGILDDLAMADERFGQELGRSVLMLSHTIPAEAIIEGFVVDEEALKRRARTLKSVGDDIGIYMESIDLARADLHRYQAYLLLALAVKGTETSERFLADQLEGDNTVLRQASAIALLFYGHDRAINLLEAEASSATGDARARLDELIRVGQSRREEKRKVIDLADVAAQRPERPVEPPRRRSLEDHENLRCSICGRSQDQVDRLMSGNRFWLCNVCISTIHDHRDDLTLPDDEEHSCHLCRRSIFEVQSVYRVNDFMMCDLCLDQCVRLLRRDGVDRFLKDFS
jgi:tetratricopeptide (TPR) repeat protein